MSIVERSTAGSHSRVEASYLDLASFHSAPLRRDPFDHVVVENIIEPRQLDAILGAFPDVPGAGSHLPASLRISADFAKLLVELDGDAFHHVIEQKFGVDLTGRPTVTTIRGQVRATDGAVHTDSRSKLITVLIYLNRDWRARGGRLRLLRSPDLEDFAVETAPEAGTLIAFRRSAHSWHGHAPFIGPRRAVQMSYVTDRATALREEARHRLATGAKRVVDRLFPGRSA